MEKLTLKKIILTFAMMVLVMGTFVACGSNAGENTEKESELQLVPEEELEGKKFKRGDVFADMTFFVGRHCSNIYIIKLDPNLD